MPSTSYLDKRHQLQEYFDRTAVAAWERLTSDAPVSRIRQKVRAGRDDMRATLLDWLPADLTGRRVLDAGCGTGALSIEAARRGADVVGIDISPNLIDLARQRTPEDLVERVHFEAGDMLGGGGHGQFDHIVAMDSLIHYHSDDMLSAVAGLQLQLRGNTGPRGIATLRGDSAWQAGEDPDASRTTSCTEQPCTLLFTFAPRTPLLMAVYHAGKLFPRSDRSPAIEPVSESLVRKLVATRADLAGTIAPRTRRIDASFYKSQAIELIRYLPVVETAGERQSVRPEPHNLLHRTGKLRLTGDAANA